MAISSDQDPTLEASRTFLAERQLWRERTLGGLLASALAALSFAAIWLWLIPPYVPEAAWLLGASSIVLLGLLLARRRLPFALCAALLLVSVYAASLGTMLVIGFGPNAVVGLSTVAVAAALLFGRTHAILAVSMMSAGIIGVSLLHSRGLVGPLPVWAEIVDSAQITNGLRVTGVFALLSASSVIGIAYLLKRSEDLALRQVQSFQALQREHLEKERLRHDLELGQAALIKARELETLGRLAGSMAHDFNNALLVIWASIDELSEHAELSAEGRAALSALRAAADQGAATTRNLRAFGPLGPRHETTLSLESVVSRAQATLSRVLPPNIVLEADIQIDAAVAADEGELLRILTNLVLNARDAMPEGGTIALRVRPSSAAERARAPSHSNRVAIDVADTGTGMEEHVKQRLFEPFFTTKHSAGTGLGLVTVRDIVQAHGGDVAVESELGQGTTITLLWPVALESTAPAPEEPAPSVRGNKVVLLVDDDPAVLSVLAKSLARAGFTVLEASNASEGLEVLRRGQVTIDVLCTDWMMPGRPAQALIDEFQRLHGGPVLVCSGYAPAETSISLELVDDFLAKPFTADELVRRIQQLLTQHRREQRALQGGTSRPRLEQR